MSKKMMLLALAAVSAAMFALPAVASAGVWHAEPSIVETPFTTTTAGHGNTILFTESRETICSGAPSSTGTGSFDVGGTTGKISLTFNGCKSLGTNCTTPGQAAGVIKTSANLVFHNILLENKNLPNYPNGKAGVKITGVGSETQLAHYVCGFGLVTVNVTGTVVGEVEQECGTKGKLFSLKFEAVGNVQRWNQITTEGTKTDLIARVNGGEPETGGQTGTGTINLGANEREIKCTF